MKAKQIIKGELQVAAQVVELDQHPRGRDIQNYLARTTGDVNHNVLYYPPLTSDGSQPGILFSFDREKNGPAGIHRQVSTIFYSSPASQRASLLSGG